MSYPWDEFPDKGSTWQAARHEFENLLSVVEQAVRNIDFDNRAVHSWAALCVLKNALEYHKEHLEQLNADCQEDCPGCEAILESGQDCPISMRHRPHTRGGESWKTNHSLT